MGVSNFTEAKAHTYKSSIWSQHVASSHSHSVIFGTILYIFSQWEKQTNRNRDGFMVTWHCPLQSKPKRISAFVKSIHTHTHTPIIYKKTMLEIYIYISAVAFHVLILISNSLCAHSQKPHSIRLKLLCVCRMICALKQAAVPWRSPLLCWCHQTYTSFSFVPPHIPHVRSRDGGGGIGGVGVGVVGFIRVSWVRNENGQRQVVWTQLLPSQVAGDFDMWYTNRILQLHSQSTCGSHLLGRQPGEVFAAHYARRQPLCSMDCYTSCVC